MTERGRSNVQHYGSTDKRGSAEPELEEEDGERDGAKGDLTISADSAESEVSSRLSLSKQYIALVNLKNKFIQRVIVLWDLLMSVNYVFSIVAMMVRTLLYCNVLYIVLQYECIISE